jgi:hypothetical protein
MKSVLELNTKNISGTLLLSNMYMQWHSHQGIISNNGLYHDKIVIFAEAFIRMSHTQ